MPLATGTLDFSPGHLVLPFRHCSHATLGAAPVHEIFISYSSKHRDLTRELAVVLEAQYGAGSVWWDQELESRGPYGAQIDQALNEARVVVVIWTTGVTNLDTFAGDSGAPVFDARTNRLVGIITDGLPD
jgi:hypothetical protein